MKRYFVFVFDTYYPLGGMNDFKGNSATLEGAMLIFDKYQDSDYRYVYYLNDSGDFEIVLKYETEIDA